MRRRGVAAFALALVLAAGAAYAVRVKANRMPDVWAMQEVPGLDQYPGETRGLYGVCENGFVIAVSLDSDHDGDPDMVAYFLVPARDMGRPNLHRLEDYRPFLIQVDNEKNDQDIQGDVFLADWDLDGKIDARLNFPHPDLGRGPCEAAQKVRGVKHISSSKQVM